MHTMSNSAYVYTRHPVLSFLGFWGDNSLNNTRSQDYSTANIVIRRPHSAKDTSSQGQYSMLDVVLTYSTLLAECYIGYSNRHYIYFLQILLSLQYFTTYLRLMCFLRASMTRLSDSLILMRAETCSLSREDDSDPPSTSSRDISSSLACIADARACIVYNNIII